MKPAPQEEDTHAGSPRCLVPGTARSADASPREPLIPRDSADHASQIDSIPGSEEAASGCETGSQFGGAGAVKPEWPVYFALLLTVIVALLLPEMGGKL